MVAPVPLAQAQGEGGRAAAGEDADRAVGRLEAVLDVERLPRASLLVLGEADAVVGVVVALRAEVGQARHRAALQVLRQQAEGPPDGGVGQVVWAHGAGAPV